MQAYQIIILAIFLSLVLLEIIFTNFFNKKNQRPKDVVVELVGFLQLNFFAIPLIMGLAYGLADTFFPATKGIISELGFFAIFGLLLIFDDLTQYWWHRTCHSVPILYNLHRAHHDPEYLSIRIVFRNSVLYYFLMPGLWLSGVLFYMGSGWVFFAYIVIKQTVIFGAHTDLRWDKKLYEIKWMNPIMWVLERTISTPSTHWAHHGKHLSDENTHYKGNYGNLLFVWDIIFGTAKITRKYPKEIGVENLDEASALTQLFWPIFRSPQKSTIEKA